MDRPWIPRFARAALEEALADTPVVLIHGPRQCGKTFLARTLGEAWHYDYYSFDDPALKSAALADPVGFVHRLPDRVILDEIQRVPELFVAIKQAVDDDRRPGRFILTGSANVLLLPRLSDSLAGRLAIIRLYPFAQLEIEAGKGSGSTGGQGEIRPEASLFGQLFAEDFQPPHSGSLGDELVVRLTRGGFPEAVFRDSDARRRNWYQNYVTTLMQRDIRDLARIRRLDVMPRLLQSIAERTGALLNVSALANALKLKVPMVNDYVTLLRNLFLVELLPAWHNNRSSRLVKMPKLHLGDAGLASHLLKITLASLQEEKNRHRLGPLLETFVFNELLRQASPDAGREHFHHFRDRDGYEVDIVIEEAGGELVGVEVKAAATVRERDFKGLKRLRRLSPDRFHRGVILYDGEHLLPFGEGFFAVPISALWGGLLSSPGGGSP